MKPEAISAGGAQTVWTIDPQYATVQFSVRNLFFMTVTGSFTEFGGTITLGEDDIKHSSVEAAIRAESIGTGIRRRDTHLRSPDFLDAEKYPEIRFQSLRVEKGRDRDMLRVTGELTIKDRSREIALDVWVTDRSRSPQGDEVAYYTAMAEIDRHGFGVSYGRGLIGRAIKILIQVQAMKQR
ncbi:MAG: YceI family protein [Blastocatellales bacterium]